MASKHDYSRGLFNRYRKGMPLPERLVKDAGVLAKRILAALSGKKLKVMLVYPHYPSKRSAIYRIAKHLGYEVTNRIDRRADAAMYYEYATIRSEYAPLEQLKSPKVINLHSRNISKDKVDRDMLEAFGYCTRVDPTTYTGVAVRKSLTNAVHDGVEVQCPLVPEEGFIYQKLIDTTVSATEVMDLRVPVVGGYIPHMFLNYKPKNDRFKNVADRAIFVKDVGAHLSTTEVSQITEFCRIAHLDFVELDVLRDSADGRIYIVDANNTPQSPPTNLPKSLIPMAVASLAACFKQVFLNQ